ncbi:MAG: T9SS type A sorting domain-containing protein [Lewinellaceae bacterium]|nr:T9SS type A sorting domain-containing protein [Lewinellaceae bacterium]
MKRIFLRSIILILFSLCLAQEARSTVDDGALSCPLPPPEWLMITNTTTSSISVAWQPIPGQLIVEYKVSTFNITTQTSLPDQYTNATAMTLSNLPAGNEFSIEVRASSCAGGPYGLPIYVIGRTNFIITDDLVQACPSGQGINRNSGHVTPINITPANNQNPTTEAYKFTVEYGNSIVELSVWADCNYWPRVKETFMQNVTRYPEGSGFQTDHVEYILPDQTKLITLDNPEYTSFSNKTTLYVSYYQDNVSEKQCSGLVGCSGGNCCGGGGGGSNPKRNIAITSSPANSLAMSATPNPNSGVFQAEFTLPSESPVRMVLTDLTGHVVKVLDTAEPVQAGTHTTSFYLEDLPAGMYLLSVQTNDARQTATVIKQ